MQINGRIINIDTAMDNLGLEQGSVVSNNRVACCIWPENHASGDSNPSFSISLETGAWICYAGCGAGTLESLVERVRGCNPKEAKRWLLTMSSEDITFDRMLKSLPKTVKDEYRPIDDTVKVAQADYALQSDDVMSEYFFDRGFTVETMLDWGIRYDRSMKALVIPIYDRRGDEIISVVRRLVPPVSAGIAKYRFNVGFERKMHLFGAGKHLRDGSPTIVVEGRLTLFGCISVG